MACSFVFRQIPILSYFIKKLCYITEKIFLVYFAANLRIFTILQTGIFIKCKEDGNILFWIRAVDRILKSRIKSYLKSRIKSDLSDFLTGRKPLLL